MNITSKLRKAKLLILKIYYRPDSMTLRFSMPADKSMTNIIISRYRYIKKKLQFK